ncbi:hypothetical protein [Pseudomonas moorei]|uniref:hypothetical protein n=1 Tax=Pseudomonas moorei TaxID=395599 RepID=UPI00200E0FE8|nr:hypothetical protein [Pseudomonas moorei]
MFSPADPASFIQNKQRVNHDLQVLEPTGKEAIRRPSRLDLKRSPHCTLARS